MNNFSLNRLRNAKKVRIEISTYLYGKNCEIYIDKLHYIRDQPRTALLCKSKFFDIFMWVLPIYLGLLLLT